MQLPPLLNREAIAMSKPSRKPKDPKKAKPAIEKRIDRLPGYLGIEGGFDGFMGAVLDLRARIGVPHTLTDLGVDEARRDDIAAMAIVDPTASGNPVELTVEAAGTIFDMALSGVTGGSTLG